MPQIVDWLLSGVIIGMLAADLALSAHQFFAGQTGDSRIRQAVWLVFFVAGVSSVALSQQRLQPWMYHLLLLTPILAIDAGRPPTIRSVGWRADWSPQTLIRVLTASIYLWSAWSKLDVSFARDHGSDVVDALAGSVGLSTRFWSPETRANVAVMLPISELLVGVAILIPRVARKALWLSLAMHGALLLAVGPWGMNHSWGVILWNLFFIGQNTVLALSINRRRAVLSQPDGDDAIEPLRPVSRIRVFATVVTVTACLAPVLRSVHCFDNWPSWAVYAASTHRVTVRISAEQAAQLPSDLRDYVHHYPSTGQYLRIDLWSLNVLNAPLYPQERLQFAVVKSLRERYSGDGLRDGFRIWIGQPADRWTGIREVTEVFSDEEFRQQAATYWLNLEERR